VRIDALPKGKIRIDGTIAADGGSNSSHYSGKGAGGSICLRARTFEGSGQLWARGGSSGSTVTRGGGGGRIAIWRTNHAWTGAALERETLTAGGTGTSANGETGTVYLGLIPASGTVLSVR